MKSERLKKLESELNDLQQWMKLGLVPKKELDRHQEEIHHIEGKIHEERERLAFLKESGDVEEYQAPRRGPAKTVYADTPTISDVEINSSSETTDVSSFTTDTESTEIDVTESEHSDEEGDKSDHTEYDADDDPFSDRNRWRRGGILDPDATDW